MAGGRDDRCDLPSEPKRKHKAPPMSPRARRFFGCVMPLAIALAGCGGALLLGFAGRQVFFQTERMRDEAMQPIIASGLDLFVDNTAYWADEPVRGTIVNVGTPEGAAPRHLVGLPGETLSLERGQLIIDGQACDGSTIHGKPCFFAMAEGETPADFGPIRLGPEDYFVLANRAAAADSRLWGAIPRAAIFGIVRFSINADRSFDPVQTPAPEPTEAPS